MSPLITFTTDFGNGSSYVAQMKGVVYSRLPQARVVDVCHDLPAHDLTAAELLLRGTAWAFPLGTVQVVVVDPGVGTSRRPIAVSTRGMYFVGPDNGVLGQVLAQEDAQVVELDRPALWQHPVSSTFHGRDIFTPVAVELAAGLPLTEVGGPIYDALPSTLPAVQREGGALVGQVLGADRFGNLLTNIPGADAHRVWVEGAEVPRYSTYGEAPPDALVAIVGSDGYLELAVREGNAAERMAAGTPVRVAAPNVHKAGAVST